MYYSILKLAINQEKNYFQYRYGGLFTFQPLLKHFDDHVNAFFLIFSMNFFMFIFLILVKK